MGVQPLPDGDSYQLHNLFEDMIAKGATSCAVFARLNNKTLTQGQTPLFHYTAFWILSAERRLMVFYDPKNGLSGPLLASDGILRPKELRDYEGIIFGKNCKNRSLFFFNIPTNFHMQPSTEAIAKIRENLTIFTDEVFLNHLHLKDCGLMTDTLMLFEVPKESSVHVLYKNNLVVVKESNLRNINTRT